MKKRITLGFACLLAANCLYGQGTQGRAPIKPQKENIKPVLESPDFVSEKFPAINLPDISRDGKFVSFPILHQPEGGYTLVVQSLTDHRNTEIVNTKSTGLWRMFSSDSKQIVFKTSDSLSFLTLGTGKTIAIPNVGTVKRSGSGKGEWLAYQLKVPGKELVLTNLVSGAEQRFKEVSDYSFDDNERVLLVKTSSNADGHVLNTVQWVDLSTRKTKVIWSSASDSLSIGKYAFDRASTQIALIANEKIKGSAATSTIWYYRNGMDKAERLVYDGMPAIHAGLLVAASTLDFSKNGRELFFSLKEKDFVLPGKGIDVWSYLDTVLQSQQLADIQRQPTRSYRAMIRLQDRHLVKLEDNRESILTNWFMILLGKSVETEVKYNETVLLMKRDGHTEWNWNKADLASVYVYNANDGSKKIIKKNMICDNVERSFRFSPSGRFVVFYDNKWKDFVSYEVKTGISRNISKSVPIDWKSDDEMPDSPYELAGGWWFSNKNDTLTWARDYNGDIWQMDLMGRIPPLNFTNGYGRKNHVKFYFNANSLLEDALTDGGSKVLLKGECDATKMLGLYSKRLVGDGNPELITTQYGPSFVKAADKEVCVLQRASDSEFANLYVTTDWKHFKAITDLHPEKKYNWYTSELVTWKTFGGGRSEGILFKPENFDPHKKYPIIFSYYDNRGDIFGPDFLNKKPAGTIDIQYYVSNGYLVFQPDIHYPTGKPSGQSAYDAVVSAAQFLSRRKYVDASKMGIIGHSFGAFQTNYIVTHTHIFAAAVSSAGVADWVSEYLNRRDDNDVETTQQLYYELGQPRMGATLWQRPDLYIKNSPVFSADKVTTPLLLGANYDDTRVHFTQGYALFTALRRFGKRVWMLQHDGADHSAIPRIYTTQFFNHYLKGDPAPVWMTRGIPARMKGIDNGLELDSKAKDPPPSPLIQKTVRKK